MAQRVRGGSVEIGVIFIFTNESLDHVGPQRTKHIMLAEHFCFGFLIASTHPLARVIQRVLEELDAERLEQTAQVGHRPDVVVGAPDHQFLARKDGLDERL